MKMFSQDFKTAFYKYGIAMCIIISGWVIEILDTTILPNVFSIVLVEKPPNYILMGSIGVFLISIGVLVGFINYLVLKTQKIDHF